ncbi:MAG: hypothetical protein FWD37_04205 [Methanomassiliicoccaceae archaeon]|nr:hypothetical protein [Methanomassiliicoccaceae archaeon]
MKLNKKGEGGFMESIVAVMVIVISLTAFLSFLAFSTSQSLEKEADVPTELLSGISIVNGSIETDAKEKIMNIMERNSYRGVRFTLSLDGIYDDSVIFSAGTFDSDVIISRTGSLIAPSDDGRHVPVRYSLAVWL